MVALHSAAIPPGYKAGAIFWRDLWLAGKGLDNVRWWRTGANQLKASVDRVRPTFLHPSSLLLQGHACMHAMMTTQCYWR